MCYFYCLKLIKYRLNGYPKLINNRDSANGSIPQLVSDLCKSFLIHHTCGLSEVMTVVILQGH